MSIFFVHTAPYGGPPTSTSRMRPSPRRSHSSGATRSNDGPLLGARRPRTSGANSWSFSGTNAHVAMFGGGTDVIAASSAAMIVFVKWSLRARGELWRERVGWWDGQVQVVLVVSCKRR